MSEMMSLAARMQHAGASILAEHPDGLPAPALWRQLVERLPSVEEEFSALKGGSTSFEGMFSSSSINLVKAGFLTKAGRRWLLTPVGRWALREHAEPETFYLKALEGYAYWSDNRIRFDLLQRLIEAVPEGSWISAAALAEEGEVRTRRLIAWLQGTRPEGWHRVLDDHGRLPAEVPVDETERDEWLSALRNEGVDFSQGRASLLKRLPVSDLRQLQAEEIAEGEAARRAWLVRGSNVQGDNLIRHLWLPEGVCSLPASRLRALAPGVPLDMVRVAMETDYTHASAQDRARLSVEYHMFLSRMREDDIVLTNDGSQVYLGVVTGLPEFVSSVNKRANLQRTVKWRNIDRPLDYVDDLPDEFSARVSNPDAEIIELTEFLPDLERLLGEPAVVVDREMRLPDPTGELAERLLVGEDWLQECVDLLRDRPQLVFYGPPGTGKTYLAQHLADHLTGGKPENVQLVQFHPAYSYEDFFEGFRPQASAAGAVAFELVRGPFKRLAAAAAAHPGEPYVLIIDEINRGALAKIFGELYFLLEYRNRAVNLLYGSDEGKGFSLPRNVIIIGTMNTADRSIALMDAAMRRRFWFVELHPDEAPARDMLAEWLRKKEWSDEPARLLAELNRRIDDRDFRIGPAYLMRDSVATEAGLARIWRTQILPLLEEHHFGDGVDVAERYGLPALRDGLA